MRSRYLSSDSAMIKKKMGRGRAIPNGGLVPQNDRSVPAVPEPPAAIALRCGLLFNVHARTKLCKRDAGGKRLAAVGAPGGEVS
jgi:hypothetical protein